MVNRNCKAVNVLDLINVMGEEETVNIINTFSSPINPSIENYLKKNAINFSKQHVSMTYLVIDNEKGLLLGYFTLALKPASFMTENISKSFRKKLLRYGKMSEDNIYDTAAYLIAQFGKNYAMEPDERIDGTVLMDIAVDAIGIARHWVGGGVIFLDCQEEPKLLDFYENKVKFVPFGKRFSLSDKTEYIQMVRVF